MPAPGQAQISAEARAKPLPINEEETPPETAKPRQRESRILVGVPGGAIDTGSGEFYPRVGGGVINTRSGEFYPRVGGGGSKILIGVPGGAIGLLIEEFLPLAREGLEGRIDSEDIDRYLSVIEERVLSGRTGSTWALKSLVAMKDKGMRGERLTALADTDCSD